MARTPVSNYYYLLVQYIIRFIKNKTLGTYGKINSIHFVFEWNINRTMLNRKPVCNIVYLDYI